MDLKKLRDKAEKFFRKRWSKQSHESVSDFGAYCVEQWLSGRHIETSWEYLSVDYLRKFGLKYKERGSSDMLSQVATVHLEDAPSVSARYGDHSKDLDRFENSEALRDKRLPRAHRVIFILFYEWGFTLREIADLFGVSESRICQQHTQALREHRLRLTNKPITPVKPKEVKDDPVMEIQRRYFDEEMERLRQKNNS